MDSRIGGRPAGPTPADGTRVGPAVAPTLASRGWRISTRPRGTMPTWWSVGAALLIVALLTAGLHVLFR
jgi:hypothetical protein